MPAKRQRPESFSPPPAAVYVLVDGVSESSDREAQSTPPKQHDQLPVDENHLATTTTGDGDNNNTRQATSDHHPADDGIIYIDCSDEEEGAVSGNASEPPAGAAGDKLLGLHQGLMAQSARIAALLAAPVGDSFVKLTEIPEHASWNNEDHLGDIEGRALVIVAFGSLHFVNLMFGREMLPSFSVSIELFRDDDRVALQQLLDRAGSDEQEATRMLRAFRAGHDEHARLLNVYNCMCGTDPGDEGIPCGLNELAAGDVVRLVMRCVKVVDEYNGRVSVDFKLRKVDLVLPIPRSNDIRN